MSQQKSDLSRAFSEDGACKTHVGGQALLEGVMMRGKLNWAAAIREPNGNIYIEQHPVATAKAKNAWLNWPFVRGCYAMVQSLSLGYKALDVAANHAYDEAGESWASLQEAQNKAQRAVQGDVQVEACAAAKPSADAPAATAPFADAPAQPTTCVTAPSADVPAVTAAAGTAPNNAEPDEGFLGKYGMAVSMVLGLVLGIVLFIVAPAALTNLIIGEYDSNPILWNVFDGIVRVAIFVLYLWLIGHMSDTKRMFAYHGAEHKTIHCYEHGLELTPENARRFPRLHVRCGTAFLIMVMIIAIFVYTVIPVPQLILALGVPDGAPKLILVILIRILFMPVIAGISYEITVKWAGSNPDNPLVKIVLWPGMQMQYLTTNEPDDSMLECAIAAMKEVLACEEAAAQKTHNAQA